VVTPLRIAELLIQRADMPRSLLACLNELMVNLDAVSGGQRGQSLRIAGRMQAELQYLSIDAEFAPTIHLFLTNFLAETHRLGLQISEEFLVPIAATA
ncbi:MAG TPA: alpha-E domain-containing protein, partial [Burkholderiaceae bacterium]|nr:alpha-E domain-containing protein [Burkholderiaceae bacterium]